jgi:hypothetical protein
MTSLSLIFPLLDQWRQLRDGTRDGIIAGLLVAVVIGAVGLFHKSLLALLRHLLGVDVKTISPPQVIVNVPPVTTPPQTPQESPNQPTIPLIPKPPAVGFVARRDGEGATLLSY